MPEMLGCPSSGESLPKCRPSRRCVRWLVGLAVVLAGFVGGSLGLHPFLAVSAPVPATIMVVEGWLPDEALSEAVVEFRRGRYARVFTVGAPHPRGTLLFAYGTYAESAAATLVKLGLESDQVTAVPSRERHRNRTFNSALALKALCREHGIALPAINVVTMGAHARRSRLCFRRALGESTRVGVIALEERDYDARRWWRFSEGVKTMIGEPIGLLYAWLALDYGN